MRQNITFYIARDGKVKLLQFVASEGAPATEVDLHGQTPLFYAAREGHTATVIGSTMYLFGGSGNNAYYNDLFSFDLATVREVLFNGIILLANMD